MSPHHRQKTTVASEGAGHLPVLWDIHCVHLRKRLLCAKVTQAKEEVCSPTGVQR